MALFVLIWFGVLATWIAFCLYAGWVVRPRLFLSSIVAVGVLWALWLAVGVGAREMVPETLVSSVVLLLYGAAAYGVGRSSRWMLERWRA